jgi:hypothetical protein
VPELWTLGGSEHHIQMNTDTKAIVEQCPTLHFQVNKGERHRIMRSDIRRGSLWIAPRLHYYSVTPSGEVEALLSHFLHSHFGAETGQDYKGRWKVWNIPDLAGITKLIQRFGEPS